MVYSVGLPERGSSNEYSGHGISFSEEIKENHIYHIQPNYRTYSFNCTVNQFHSLPITAIVLFVYFFRKAYVVSTYLNCIDLYPQHMPICKENQKKESHNHYQMSFSDLFRLDISEIFLKGP